jgi:hypothetical protein
MSCAVDVFSVVELIAKCGGRNGPFRKEREIGQVAATKDAASFAGAAGLAAKDSYICPDMRQFSGTSLQRPRRGALIAVPRHLNCRDWNGVIVIVDYSAQLWQCVRLTSAAFAY